MSPKPPNWSVFFSTSFWSKIISRYTRTIYASRALHFRGDISSPMTTNHSQVLLKTEVLGKFQLWPREPPYHRFTSYLPKIRKNLRNSGNLKSAENPEIFPEIRENFRIFLLLFPDFFRPPGIFSGFFLMIWNKKRGKIWHGSEPHRNAELARAQRSFHRVRQQRNG